MEFFRGKTLIFKNSSGVNKDFMEFLEKKGTFSRISSGVDPFLREVFRGECSLVEFFRGKKKSYSSTGGVRILNAIAQWYLENCRPRKLFIIQSQNLGTAFVMSLEVLLL